MIAMSFALKPLELVKLFASSLEKFDRITTEQSGAFAAAPFAIS
jgi:hypothetical protein